VPENAPSGSPDRDIEMQDGSQEDSLSKIRMFGRSVPAVYIKHILLTWVFIIPAASYQAINFYPGFDPHFFILPFFVSIAFGMVMGRYALLKQRLRDKGEQFRAIADLAQEFTYYRRIDGHYEYVSPACMNLTGYSPEDFYTTPNLMDLLIHPDDRERWSHHVHTINEGGEPESFDLRLISRDNRVVWFNHICAPVYNKAGKQIGVRSTNLDITRRKEDETRIEHMAYFDALTELPNRRSLVLRIRKHIDNMQTNGKEFALLFLDLDRFKNINDSLGHSFGDRLLKLIAERLRAVCSSGCMVSRFGGDEFILLLMGVRSKEAATEVAKRLLSAIEQPLEVDGIDLHVSASVGITFYPQDGTDEDTLIRNADVAMYKTKRGSGGNIGVYSSDFSDEAAHFVSTESKVQKGLLNGEFVAFYQPKVDMRDGRIIGMEALARWLHPEQGLIPPGDFIPIAEETGQINALGRQMLGQVVADVSRWQELGFSLPVAINVSARQFADHDYCQNLVADIQASGCALPLIELEITEQVFLGDMKTAIERLRQIRAAGLTIALDDFGTGYSSFNYIKELPIDTLKIDRSFVTHIDTDKAEYAILKALVSMCNDLHLNMIVEGVETASQREALVELGCSKAQGYYFHRPMPAAEVEVLLRGQQQRRQVEA